MKLKFWRVSLIFLAVAILGAQTPTFDVAVIHQAAMPTPDSRPNGQFRAGNSIGKDSADFNFTTFAELLPYAYRVKSFQVTGPALLKELRWNIQTKFAEGDADRVPEMMQALLIERFGLKMHREKREQPVYELVVAKGGPKLEVADPNAVEPEPEVPFRPFGGPGGPGAAKGKGKGFPGGPGGRGPLAGALGGARMEPNPETCGMRLAFSKLTMDNLADTLTPFLDRPVLNATQLTGTYKAALNLPMDVMQTMMQNQARAGGLPGPGGPGGPGARGGPGGPGGRGGGPEGRGPGGCEGGAANGNGDIGAGSQAIFQAVQQLGLRLQAKKAPFDTIVVDHIEKAPSEN